MSSASQTSEVAVLWRLETDDAPVALDAAAGTIAVAGAEGTCLVLDSRAGRELARVRLDGGLLGAKFSPDGAHLVLFGPGGYCLWHRDGSAGQTVAAGWSAQARWAGSERFAVAAGRTAMVLGSAGEPLWRTAPAPSTVTDLAWIRNGRELAVSAYNGVYRYAKHQAGPVAEFAYPGSHLSLAVSAEDRWICTGNQDSSVHVWRVRDGEELEMGGYQGKVSRTVFDPTGRWLANDGAAEVTVWDFAGSGPGGSAPRILKAHEAVAALAWRPGQDGLLASAGAENQVALWHVPSARAGRDAEPGVLIPTPSAPVSLAWLDSAFLMVGCRGGEVLILGTAAALAERGHRLR